MDKWKCPYCGDKIKIGGEDEIICLNHPVKVFANQKGDAILGGSE